MQGIASEHPQINTILKGNIWDVDLTKDVTGVYLIYDVVSIAPNGFNGIDYSLDLFICDNVTELNTATNEVSVQNDCSLIALDIMAIFENYNKADWADKDLNVVLNKTWSIQPFAERFDSLYAGAAVNMSLSTSYGYARCQVPVLRWDGVFAAYKFRLQSEGAIFENQTCTFNAIKYLLTN
jgi:hypothetical protein